MIRDPNGDFLSITGVGRPGAGPSASTARPVPSPSRPTTGYTGPADFSYAISDGRGGTSSAFVNMTVLPPITTVSLFSSSDTPAILSDPRHRPGQSRREVRVVARRHHYGHQILPGRQRSRHAYRLALDQHRHAAGERHLRRTKPPAAGSRSILPRPVSITAGTTYVASYHSNGHYAITGNYFTTNHVNGPLTAGRQQWRLCLRQRQSVPDQHIRRLQLLGRRRIRERQPAAGRGERHRLQHHTKYNAHFRGIGSTGQRQRSERRCFEDHGSERRGQRRRQLQQSDQCRQLHTDHRLHRPSVPSVIPSPTTGVAPLAPRSA